MRTIVVYEALVCCCVLIALVAGNKEKYNNNVEDKSQRKTNKKPPSNIIVPPSSEESDELSKLVKRNKNVAKHGNKDGFSEEKKEDKKYGKHINQGKKEEGEPKKFIGRIEHGKVKVLRKKEKQETSESDEKVCEKSKKGKQNECFEIDSSEETGDKTKPKKQIKYSIKFQHEKQKKTAPNGDSMILRLHKNGRKRYGRYDEEDDSSEEDEAPIKKRFILDEDDD